MYAKLLQVYYSVPRGEGGVGGPNPLLSKFSYFEYDNNAIDLQGPSSSTDQEI